MGESGDIVELLRERLLQSDGALPTSALGRLGRTARAVWSTGRAARKAAKAPDGLDAEALVAAVTSIGQLKGIAMKAGQIMSYIDIALPEEVRNALAVLQTHAQPMPIERVAGILRAELGEPGAELATALEPVPVAAASIGQVHRATLPDGRRVAVKVRYPEVEASIRKDFGPASAASQMTALLFPKANIKGVVAEARARFLEECDYEHEADAQERFRALYEGDETIVVPAVHRALSSRGVLTTDFIFGARLDEWLAGDPPQEERDRIGVALFGFYLGTLFRHGLYNCDPHPGNYLFLHDKRIAVLDYGCTRAFDVDFLEKLRAVSRATHRDDRDALHAALVGIGFVREGDRYDFETARRFVRGYHGPMLHDRTGPIDLGEAMTMKEVTKQKMELLKLTLPGELLFLFRIRFGLMSVLARIGSRANWHRLELAAIGD